jgi:TonB family protein
MKLLLLMILFLPNSGGLAQTDGQPTTPVHILYGERTPEQRRLGPVHSGILNVKLLNKLSPEYPQKAKDNKIQGRVEVQVLVNEDGEVIFANPTFGPQELWAASVKAAVDARFAPLRLAGKPAMIEGRIIFSFKNGEATVPQRIEY